MGKKEVALNFDGGVVAVRIGWWLDWSGTRVVELVAVEEDGTRRVYGSDSEVGRAVTVRVVELIETTLELLHGIALHHGSQHDEFGW